MTVECPQCGSANPSDSGFCNKCGTQIKPGSAEISVSQTETLQTPLKELTTGSTFAGRYQIIEELGKGGMGKVYRVLDKKLHEEVALKLIKPEIASDKKTLERFKNELKLARKVSQKNVGRMFDIGEETGSHYITMEYVPGEDLKSFIRRVGQMPIGKTISIAKQICEGLAEAHSIGIVHRDLKPSNIMIDKNGNARIMDFGIARSLRGKGITGAGMIIGTPEYMSPEQVDGKDADQRSDIYSLGVILYEMLTGRLPFEGETPLSIAVQHRSDRPKDPKEFNAQIPDDLDRIILKCLEKKPEDRFQATGDILSEIARIEQGLPTTERIALRPRPTTSKQITVSFTPKKLLIPAIALAVLLLVVVLIWKPWAGTSLIRPSDAGLPSIGFLKLRNGTGDANLDHLSETIPDLLISDLDQSRFFRVQSAEVINQVLRQMNLTEKTSFAADELREIARRSGVTTLVTGNFSKFGDNFRINISLNDAEGGDVLNTEKADGKSENDVYTLVDELTRKIKSNFNLTKAQLSSDQDKEIGKITTEYPDAYRFYSQGRDLFLRGQHTESIQLMERAIEIDPDFAMAYRSIAASYGNMGYRKYRDKIKEYYDLALEKSDRLTDKEKKLIEAQHSRSVENNWRKALSIFKELLDDYPEDSGFNWNIALIYSQRREYDKAIRHYEVCRKNRIETSMPYNNLALIYMVIGEYEKAREIYRECIELFGDTANSRRRLAGAYIGEGRLDEAVLEGQKAIEINPRAYTMGFIYSLRGDFEEAEKDFERWLNDDDAYYRMAFRGYLASLKMTQGKFERAESLIEDGLALANDEGDPDWAIRFLSQKLWCNNAMGRSGEGLSTAKTMENFGKLESLFAQGLASYFLHQAAKIREAADLYEKEREAIDRPDYGMGRFLYGLADLTAEKYDSAVRMLNQAWLLQNSESSVDDGHSLFLYFLGEAQRLGGNLEEARQTYERVVNLTFGKLFWGDLWAKSHLRLGEVYEKLGNQAKAIEHTERFLEMWKDADPGLPEVEDARKRLAGLKSN